MAEQLQNNVSEYVTIVQRQETTSGTHCYVAFHPELPNSLSQGNTPEEAEENLVEATELTIDHLIANNLPVPVPMSPWQVSGNFLQIPSPITDDSDFVEFGASGASYEGTEENMTLPSVQMHEQQDQRQQRG